MLSQETVKSWLVAPRNSTLRSSTTSRSTFKLGSLTERIRFDSLDLFSLMEIALLNKMSYLT